MRSRLSALAVGAVLLWTTGCSSESGAATTLPRQEPVAAQPVTAAGGACILLDYGLIEDTVGVRFDIAAADQAQNTSTCVVQSTGSTRPDLVFSVVEHTDADAATYLRQLKPAKGAAVNGLGAAAYRWVRDGESGSGPVVEVGWLTRDRQAKSLRFTYAEGTSTKDAEKLVDRLVALAKAIDG